MGWKLNLAILAGAGVAIAAVATIFQKQISNAAFTTGQTFGQIPTRLAEGFLEPFSNLGKALTNFQNSLSSSGVGGPPSATSPLAITPVDPIPPPPGQSPPYGAPGNQPNKDDTPPAGSTPGYGTIIYTVPPGGQSTTTVTQPPAQTPPPQQPPKQDKTPPPKTYASSITVNKQSTTNYTAFVGDITKQLGDYGQATINAINKAWEIYNQDHTIGAIAIPGFPVINIPIPAAFAQPPPKSTKQDVSSNDKKILGMGAVSTKNVATTPATTNWATFWDIKQIKVPDSGKLSPTKTAALAKTPSAQDILRQLQGKA